MHKVDHADDSIVLQNVSFAYTSETIVKDVTLRIPRGAYVGLIGPNGSGKSTLVKLMLGLLTPQEGSVELFGTAITRFKDWYRIGYVPQKTTIDTAFPVTVGEVVMMGRYGKLGLFRFPGKKDQEHVAKALTAVDMSAYRNHRLQDLSGGQQQRVMIARALVTEPEIIFLDEPTVGVDVKTQKQFYALLRKLNRDMKLTLVLVSHELDVVAHESSVIGYINRTLEYFGDPETFLKGEYFHELIGKEGVHH